MLLATVGCSIAVIKKTVKVSGFNDGFKPVLPRKKRRNSALEDSADDKVVGTKVQNNHSWSSETGNTTESDSIDMEEEYLVEKTNFRQKSGEEFGGVDTDITSKGSKKIVIKHTLKKPLGTINFSMENNNDDDILDGSLSLSPPLFLKHTVQVSIRKFFALDIDLGVVASKSS
ncbi:hypothetical protein G9A89_013076 [Geosiphon pyriformis]|nr:hypothetical protein G9A89_013076 [Geosiphon pyriformis]